MKKLYPKKIFSLICIILLLLGGSFLVNKVQKVGASNIKTITITFDSAPTYANVSKAPLKYNKDFAFSINADDGFKDSYSIFYKAFNGGRIANSTTFSRGAYFTDGAGNKIPFRGNFQLTTMNTNVIDAFIPIRNIGNTAYVDWAEAKEVSDKGWDITNHGWSHNGFPTPVDRIFPYPAPHNPSTIDYDYEIEQNQLAIESNVGQRPILMGQPDADPGYDPYVYINHGLYAKMKKFSSINRYSIAGTNITPTLDLNQYEIKGYVFMPLEDTSTDITNLIDFMKNSSVGGSHYWNRLTMHRFYEAEGQNGMGYQSLKQIIDYIENNYGEKGDDNAWIASSQEVYEYLYGKQNLNIGQNLSGNTLTLTLDFGSYPDAFKRQAISLLIDSDSQIQSVTSLDSGSNISFNPTSGLINTDFRFFNNNAFESDSTAKVVKVETSRTQTDYNEANDYVNAMDDSALKTSLRTRLNNVEIFAREWYVSFATSTTLSRGLIWNGVNSLNTTNKTLNEATGVVSTLKYDTINAFGGTGSNGVTPSPLDSGKYADNIIKAYVYPLSSPATPIIFKISNLDPDKVYDVELFSSKTTAGISTFYVIGNTTSATQDLNLLNNTQNTVTFYKVVPSATNDIQVNLAVGGRLSVLHLTERPKIGVPVASYPSGLYNTTQHISLSSMQSDYIKYSTVALPATCSDGTLYSTPIDVSSSETLYVRACDNSGNYAIASFIYTIDSTPPEIPTSTPSFGNYNEAQSVVLSSTGSDYIKYSFNEIPSTCYYGALYSSPILISSSTIVYVRACDNAENSSTASFSYQFDIIALASPVATPISGIYNSVQSLTFSSEGSDYIKYSTDALPATCSDGTLYSDAISIASSLTIYVRACNNSGDSSTASFTYFIDSVPPENPVSSVLSGSYNSSQFITILSEGSTYIKYDTSEIPVNCSSGTTYSEAITISTSETIYVRACDDAGNSSTGSFTYLISDGGDEEVITNTYMKYSIVSMPADCLSGTLYTNALTFPGSQKIYIRVCNSLNDSSISTFEYITPYSNNSNSGGHSSGSKVIITPKVTQILEKIEGCTNTTLFSPLTGKSCVSNTNSPIIEIPITNTDSLIQKVIKDLKFGMTDSDVKILQLFLIKQNKGPKAKLLSLNGSTNYFGKLTQSSLSEWQKANGIKPDVGYFGKITRAKIKFLNL